MATNQQKNTGLTFDASTVAPSTVFDPIPPGWYNAEITDAEVVAVKGRGSNERIKMEFQVMDGEHKGRKFFGSINHKNANAQAQEIGTKELSAICHAVNVIHVSDATQFIGKCLQVKVRVKPEDKEGGYDAQNEPKGYKPLEGATAMGGQAGPPAFAAGPPAFAGGPPPIVAPPVAPPVADFPPAGWVAHPQAPGHFYRGQEVKTEAELRAMLPAAPVAPPAPVPAVPAVPVAPAAPVAPVAPVADFPPAGWTPHPQSPGYFYTATGQVMDEATLRASIATAAPVAPVAPAIPAPAPAGVPAAPGIPAAGGVAEPPPWAQAGQ